MSNEPNLSAVMPISVGVTGGQEATPVVDADVQSARIVLATIKEKFEFSYSSVRSYRKLFLFLCYLTLMLVVLGMQNNMNGRGAKMFHMIKDNIFDIQTTTLEPSTETVVHTMADQNVFYGWLEAKIIRPVFQEAVCGDGFCSAPDEYPQFKAADDARNFVGCAADCGLAKTQTVTINFFDAWKLKKAYGEIKLAAEYGWDGVTAADWGAVDTNGAWLKQPIAGWNVCSDNLKEYGFFETVCLFDGDVSINGLPYRTAELEMDGAAFGKSKTIEVFAGEWELRIAFDNFEWTRPDGPNTVTSQVAFPAVRGEICAGAGADRACNVWSPCADASECRGTFWKGGYVDLNQRAQFDSWDDTYETVVGEISMDKNAEWLGFTYEPDVSADDLGDDDIWTTWSANCAVHSITLTDSYGDGWNGAEVMVTNKGTGAILFVGTVDAGYEAIYELGILCPSAAYDIVFTDGGAFASEVSWSIQNAAGVTVKSGGVITEACAVYPAGDDVSCGGESDGGGGTGSYMSYGDTYGGTDDGGGGTGSYMSYGDTYGGTDDGGRRLSAADGRRLDVSALYKADLADLPEEVGTFIVSMVGLKDATPYNSATGTTVQCAGAKMGDSVCDEENNNMQCGFDGGDCCESSCLDCSDATVKQWEKVPKCLSPFKLNSWLGLQKVEDDPETNVMVCSNGKTGSHSTCDVQGETVTCMTRPSEFEDFAPDGPCTTVNLGWADANWPFETSFSAGSAATGDLVKIKNLKFPYNSWEMLLEWFEHSYGAEYKDTKYLPSMMCPDCSVVPQGAAYNRITFTATPAEADEYPMFPVVAANATKDRVFVAPNAVLGGILLRQRRVELGPCESGPYFAEKYAKSCPVAEKIIKTPFGIDPAFSATSDLFRDTNIIGDYYNPAEETNAAGAPYGFFYDQGVEGVEGWPVLFDVNFNLTRALQTLQYLKDGNYIDGQTDELFVDLVMYNPSVGDFAHVQVALEQKGSGGFSMVYGIDLVDTSLYRTGTDIGRATLEFVCAGAFLLLLILEVMELLYEGPKAYLADTGNILDVINYLLQGLTYFSWILYVQATDKVDPRERWDVYEACTHVSDCMRSGRALEMNSNMLELQGFLGDMYNVLAVRLQYRSFIAGMMMLACIQTLKNLDFHPRMGLITRTIRNAAKELAYFIMLFLCILVIYAFLGTLLFGNELSRFSIFPLAFEACIEMVVGLYNPMDEAEFTYGQRVVAMFYFWSYLLLSFFILLNALLAIIVEAYDRAKNTANQQLHLDPAGYLWDYYKYCIPCMIPKHAFMSMQHLMKVTDAALDGKPGVFSKKNLSFRWRRPVGHTINLLIIPRDLLKRVKTTLFLDQATVAAAYQICCPDMEWSDCEILANRVLYHFGTNADANGDGVLQDEEIAALMDQKSFNASWVRLDATTAIDESGLRSAARSRLVRILAG